MDGPTRKGHGTDSYQLGTGEIEIDDKDRRQSNNSRKGGEGVKSALGSSGALPQSSAPCELSFPPLPLSPSSLNRLSSPMRSSLTPAPYRSRCACALPSSDTDTSPWTVPRSPPLADSSLAPPTA